MKNKMLLPLMMMLATIAVVPGNNSIVKTSAETQEVDYGYISLNLNGKEKGYIDEYNLGSEKCDNPFLGNYDVTSFNACQYDKNTNLMDYILANTDKDTSQCKTSKDSEYGYAYFYDDSGLKKSNASIVQEIYSINTFFDYPYSEDNHPMELKIKINFNTIDSFINKYIGTNTASFDYPVLSIDGEDYIYLSYSSETKEIKYNVHNSRCYLGYQTSTIDNTMYKSGYAYVEIPYRRYIETIKVLTSEGVSKEFTENAEIKIHSGWTSEEKTRFMPFIIDGIDVDAGKLSYIGTDSNYELQSITIDNSYNIDIKSPKKDDKKIESSFDTSNVFVKSLKQNTSEKSFNITSYKFLNKTTNKTELVDFGTYYAFKYITTDQIHTVTFNAISDSWGAFRRLAFNAYDNTSKIALDKISAIYFYYDYVKPFTGTPQIIKDKQSGTKALCITSKDLSKAVEAGGDKNAWAFFNAGNLIQTKDKFNTSFWLSGLKSTDYWFFHWDEAPKALKNGDKSEMFILVSNENGGAMKFKSLISCVYVDKKGTIINCSSVFPNGVQAPTYVINEDGTVSIIDANGNKIDGRVNPDTGVFEDENGIAWEPPYNIVNPKPTNILDELRKAIQKFCAILGTIAIVGGAFWVFSKVGPTIAVIVKKKKE